MKRNKISLPGHAKATVSLDSVKKAHLGIGDLTNRINNWTSILSSFASMWSRIISIDSVNTSAGYIGLDSAIPTLYTVCINC